MNDDLATLLEQSGGVVRLFPLPHVVLFPSVMLPMHIFEPRYRQMTADALTSDRLIALALLQPGWEGDEGDRPPLHPVVCLGRIIAEQRLADGRYNLIVRGLTRARIIAEIDDDQPYRSAQVEVIEDIADLTPQITHTLQGELQRAVTQWVSTLGATAASPYLKILQGEWTLGVLCDILAFALPLPVEIKQHLLELADVEERVRWLVGHLESSEPPRSGTRVEHKFPPDFSSN
jgi:Lon protease-like protein